jgi:Zn-dependent protease
MRRRPTLGQRVKQMFAPIGVAILAGWKWVVLVLKFGLPFLKVGGTMLISVWVYSMAFGWKFALGFVLLIFVHEMGHLIAAKMVGLKVGLPMFIPFVGAMIALREAPRNAWIESIIGIGGPILGSIGAAACVGLYFLTGYPIFMALAYSGFLINLFNLIPIVPLDGGRIVTAISPWLWVVGLAILLPYLFIYVRGPFMLVALFIVVMSFPRVMALFRRRTAAQMRYFECTPTQRAVMAVMYFGLVFLLYIGMGYVRRFMQINQA